MAEDAEVLGVEDVIGSALLENFFGGELTWG